MTQNTLGFSCNKCKLVRLGFHNERTMCICGNGQSQQANKGFTRVTIVYNEWECNGCNSMIVDRDHWKDIANEYMNELVKLKDSLKK